MVSVMGGGVVRVFASPDTLSEMLKLRQQGWSLKALAHKYNCDHTSVRKACIRNGVAPKVIITHKQIVPFSIAIFRINYYIDWNGERVSRGKSYRQYVRATRERERLNFANRVREMQNRPTLEA